jgi:hypothetical protein
MLIYRGNLVQMGPITIILTGREPTPRVYNDMMHVAVLDHLSKSERRDLCHLAARHSDIDAAPPR